LVDQTEVYGYAWLLPTACAGAILVLLNFYEEKEKETPSPIHGAAVSR